MISYLVIFNPAMQRIMPDVPPLAFAPGPLPVMGVDLERYTT